jgi:hypothetical protein
MLNRRSFVNSVATLIPAGIEEAGLSLLPKIETISIEE